MRFLQLLAFDLRFQFRHGFHAVYLLITVLYIVGLRALPEQFSGKLLPVILFTDPALLGLLFIGALLLLEKDAATIHSLFVTPLRLPEYLCSRLLSLGLLSLVTSLAIAAAVHNGPLPLLLLGSGVVLTAALSTLAGFALAARARSLNGFLMVSAAVITLLCLPLLEHFGLFDTVLFYLLPSRASLILLNSTAATPGTAETLYAIGYLLVWLVPAWRFAVKRITGSIIQRIGDGQ